MTDYYLDSVTGSDSDNGTTRALAKATLAGIIAIPLTAGDRVFVADTHSENLGASATYTFPGTITSPNQIICVDFTGTADPTAPVSADLSTGALIQTTGNFTITILGSFYMYGMQIKPGNSTNNASLNLGTTNAQHNQVFDTCDIGLGGSSSSANFIFAASGTSIDACFFHLKNTNLRLASATHEVRIRTCRFLWEGGTFVGTAPTSQVFEQTVDAPMVAMFRGVDFNPVGTCPLFNIGTAFCHTTYDLVDCKLPSGAVITTGTPYWPGGALVRLWNCDGADTGVRSEVYYGPNTLVTVTDMVRSGGASLRGEAFSWKMTSGANTSFLFCFPSIPVECYFSSTGSKTLTIHYIHGESAALKDNEIYAKVQYLGTSGFPIASFATDAAPDVLNAGTSQAADTAADWDDGLTARANSTVYSLNSIRRAATPNGKAFIVTTAGTSDSSEPAGFGSSNDGDSITDNTVTWRQMRREKLEVTFTVNEVGRAIVWVELAKASIPVWVCPAVEGGSAAPQFFVSPGGGLTSFAAAAGGSVPTAYVGVG